MKVRLKPLAEQTIVITGASSGIGLVTARMAAARGARVVLAARNEADLRRAAGEIRARGGRAIEVVADVAVPADVERIGDEALRQFGGFDAWVNNAAAGLYGHVAEIPLEDLRRQFDVTYWGQVYGSRVAVQHLRTHGGALINVASAAADRAIPLQANYSAAKHAVKGFTDALRIELEAADLPIAVTLIKPASIDTPFFDKAKTYLGVEPRPVAPVYAPEVVAGAILHAAEHPTREVAVGMSARLLRAADTLPRTTDYYMHWALLDGQQTDQPVNGRPDNLHHPLTEDGGERGRNWTGRTRETSAYTSAALHPRAAATALGLAAAAIVAARSLVAARSQPAGARRHGVDPEAQRDRLAARKESGRRALPRA
jgi:short-subunit dehydrogenase